MNGRIFLTLCAVTVAGWAAPAQAQTVVEVAQSDDTFSALVEAVVAADLAETLSGEGPFTVFAPTNEAFAAMPPYVLKQIQADPAVLTDILLYHVVPAEAMAADVVTMDEAPTAAEEAIRVNVADDAVYANNAQVTATDIEASNGVVHVVDQVLVPNSVYQLILDDLQTQLDMIEASINDARVM